MKRILLLLTLGASTLYAESPPPPGKTTPLFDGKTLAGWEGNAKLWRVEDGCLTGGSLTETVAHNDFLASTKDYTNFIVRFKIKLTGTEGFINSGFQIRSQRVPNNTEMAGYQCDFGEPNWYGAVYDESRRNKVMSASDMKALDPVIKRQDWNEYVIRADGPRITTWINGVQGTDYTEADPAIPDTGKFGIQVHGGGKAVVQVKDITIEELPAKPKFIPAPDPKKGAKASPLSPEEERAAFTLPPGFEIELVAAESEGIGKFVPLAFDQKGRLWTTTAFEYPVDGNENAAAAEALYASKAKDKVLVFERDAKSPTGYSPTPRVFADGLAIPLGVLPYKNGCYVQHGHDIAFLEDTDNDGRADKRTVILRGFGVQDSHLFPHQFMRAPGGWIWMAQGAFNYGKVARPGDEKNAVQFDQTRMAKFRPDGSEFTITSNGPCNIWGLVLDGEGQAWIQEANDFGYPVMPFHEYANYPGCSDSQWKSYAPEFPGTAPDFRMGGTGLSGLALSDKAEVISDQSSVNGGNAAPVTDHRSLITHTFPSAYCDVMYVANPITRKIQAIKITPDGPRFQYRLLGDFIQSSDEWFRPIAITFGPDGCLYIVDWYNKIISHNEVPRTHPERDKTRGRIWRVKHKDQRPFDVPDFTKLTGDELIAKLGGPSLAQSHLAWQAMIDRGDKAQLSKKYEPDNFRERDDLAKLVMPVVLDANASPARRIQALWTLDGLNIANTDTRVFSPLVGDAERNVRREAVKAMWDSTSFNNNGTRGVAPFQAIELLGRLIDDADSEVRAEVIRTTAQFLGERGSDGLQISGEPRTAALQLLLRLAREPLPEPLAPSTQKGKPIKVREAYDREFERYLVRMFLERHSDAVARFLDSDAAKPLTVEARLLASLALEPKASAARVAKLLPQLTRPPEKEEILRLVQFLDEPGVADAVKATLGNPVTAPAVLNALLELRTKLDPAKLAPLLTDTATTLLASKDPSQMETGVKLAGAFKLANMETALVALAQSGTGLKPVTESSGNSSATGPGNIAATGSKPVLLSLAALRALSEIGSNKTDLFASLATSASDPLLRDEALSALASSRANDAPQRVVSLYPKLAPPQRRTALDKLTTTKAGASTVVASVTAGTLPKTDLDAATLDRLLAVLGDKDPALNSLVESLGALFRPVLALDGTDGAYVETGLTLDGPFTVECWVKLDEGISNQDGILGTDGQLDINFAGEQFRVWAGKEAWDPAIAKKRTVAGMWTHVAASRDAEGKWKVYLDGELSDTGTKKAAHKIENVRIGHTIAAGGTKGQIAEFRIWKGERSAAEIRANFDRSIAAGPLWAFGGTQGLDVAHASQRQLGPGAKIIRTSDLPPVLTADTAAKLDSDFSKYTALAAQPGDKERGKAAAIVCQACHLFGTTGGQIGPNLSGVGAMGIEAILRNILTPNAAMESAYRIYRIEQRDGSVLDAFFVSEDKDAVVIRLPGAPDQRIAKKDIVRTSFLRRSLMPEGLLMGLNDQQVSDLFAFLKSLK